MRAPVARALEKETSLTWGRGRGARRRKTKQPGSIPPPRGGGDAPPLNFPTSSLGRLGLPAAGPALAALPTLAPALARAAPFPAGAALFGARARGACAGRPARLAAALAGGQGLGAAVAGGLAAALGRHFVFLEGVRGKRGWRRESGSEKKKEASAHSAPCPPPPPTHHPPGSRHPRSVPGTGAQAVSRLTHPAGEEGKVGGGRALGGGLVKKRGVGATPPDMLRRRPLARATLSPPPFRGLPCADPATRPVPWQEDREVPPSWACRVVDVGVGFGRARGPLSDDAPGLGQKKKASELSLWLETSIFSFPFFSFLRARRGENAGKKTKACS